MEWKDGSSYSRGDTERTPSVWVCRAGVIRVVVHRHIHYPKDTWLLSCDPFFNNKELPEKDADACKAIALEMVSEKLREAASAFSR